MGDIIAPLSNAKPALLVQWALPTTQQQPSRVSLRGRRGVAGRGVDTRPRKRVAAVVYLYYTNSSVLETINLYIYLGIDYLQ